MDTRQQRMIDRARQVVAEASRRTPATGTGTLIAGLSAKVGTLRYWLEELIAMTAGASGEIQQGRIGRAREVLAEVCPGAETKDTADLINDLSSAAGKLEYWVEDMIALAVEIDGPPPPPALQGYGYVLPEDYLRGGAR